MVIKAQKDKPLKLDAMDKKIFYYLSTNYRMPRNELAKLVKISPQRLNHRIKQLEKDVLEPYVCINYPVLGLPSYLLIYESLAEGEIKAITESEHTYSLVHLIGEGQYLAIIMTEDILAFCSKHTSHALPQIFPLTSYFPDKWNGFHIQPIKAPSREHINHKIDAKDYRILAVLCQDPSISLLDLSEKVKMSRQTIASRMKSLEQANIIQSYRFALNVPKLGLSTYLVHLECAPGQIKEAIDLIHHDSYSGFLYQSHNHLFFWYIVFEQNQLFEFLGKIEKKITGRVRVSQNTGVYTIKSVPEYALNFFKER